MLADSDTNFRSGREVLSAFFFQGHCMLRGLGGPIATHQQHMLVSGDCK